MCETELKTPTFNYFTSITVRFDSPERAKEMRGYILNERGFAADNHRDPVVGPQDIHFKELKDTMTIDNECSFFGFADKAYLKEDVANFIVWVHGRFGNVLKVTMVLWSIVPDDVRFQQYHWYAVPDKLIGVKLMDNHIPLRLPCMTDDDYVNTLTSAGKTFFEAYVLYHSLLYGRESAYHEFAKLIQES